MNIYFAASIRGGRELQPIYAALVEHLRVAGHTVLTEHVASGTVEADEVGQSDADIYRQDMAWLDQAQAVVAEVSVPSLGVGYEVGYALHARAIRVLGVWQAGVALSAMLTGNPHPCLHIARYEALPEALAAVDGFLAAVGS